MFTIFHVTVGFVNECQLYFGTPGNVMINMMYENGFEEGDMYFAPKEDQETINSIKSDIRSGVDPEYVNNLNFTLESGNVSCLGYAYTKEQLESLKSALMRCKEENPSCVSMSFDRINDLFELLSDRCDPVIYGSDEDCFEYDAISTWDPEYEKTLRMCNPLLHL